MQKSISGNARLISTRTIDGATAVSARFEELPMAIVSTSFVHSDFNITEVFWSFNLHSRLEGPEQPYLPYVTIDSEAASVEYKSQHAPFIEFRGGVFSEKKHRHMKEEILDGNESHWLTCSLGPALSKISILCRFDLSSFTPERCYDKSNNIVGRWIARGKALSEESVEDLANHIEILLQWRRPF